MSSEKVGYFLNVIRCLYVHPNLELLAKTVENEPSYNIEIQNETY